MSIFKRGKHAKAQDLSDGGYTGQLTGEAIDGLGRLAGIYLAPKGTEAPVSVDEVADEGWEKITDYVTPDGFDLGFNAQEYVDDMLREMGVNPFEVELDLVLGEIRALLLEKNASYGDSALNPVRIMSDADAAEQIRIRMDDKLSRLYRGFAFEDTETGNPEDTLKDLVGYYFLLKIAEARHA